MTGTPIDLATWPRAGAYRLFRGFDQPRFSLTVRLDVTRVAARKDSGLSPFRAVLYAISCGFHAVPELRVRFTPEGAVMRYDRMILSHTVGKPDGSFGYAYVPHDPDWPRFDAASRAEMDAIRAGEDRQANLGERPDMIYLSCLPWVDFTAMTNAIPDADDCIPRLSWGKFVPGADGRTTCAFCAEVHHAVCDGGHLGEAIGVIQEVLDGF